MATTSSNQPDIPESPCMCTMCVEVYKGFTRSCPEISTASSPPTLACGPSTAPPTLLSTLSHAMPAGIQASGEIEAVRPLSYWHTSPSPYLARPAPSWSFTSRLLGSFDVPGSWSPCRSRHPRPHPLATPSPPPAGQYLVRASLRKLSSPSR